MTSSYRAALIAWMLLALSLAAPLALAADELAALEPSPEQVLTAERIMSKLTKSHYVQKRVEDLSSEALFDAYLKAIDPSRLFLLASDIEQFHPWRGGLDEALLAGDLEPAFSMFNRLRERRLAELDALVDGLDGRLDALSFDGDETLLLDRSEAPWPADAAEAAHLLGLRFKNEVLGLRLAEREPDKIRDVLERRYTGQRRRLGQVDAGDVFRVWMNVVTHNFDPHTEFFPPRDAENFDIRMSLSLEGIGAMLGSEGEYCKVERIVPGGPAEQDGRLKAADRIVAVGQGASGDSVDVVGWRNDEIVELIRGPKDTVVRLSVLPAGQGDGAALRVIDITRDEVRLEEQAATSEVIELVRDDGPWRVGVIHLPTFYIDFEAARAGDPEYRSATRDVAALVRELADDDVDGIVMDLRGNGGGSLFEAQELTGLFLGKGPVVQIRGVDQRVDVAPAPPESPLWSGPMGVLVDRLSASASEIFSAAVQDTKRGLVLGSRTFGKGSVQALVPFEDGQLKLTQAMFYRLSGGSTQHMGVLPDVLFPSLYNEDEIGESALDGALPWESIPPAKFKPKKTHDFAAMGHELTERHQQRLQEEPELVAVVERLELSQELRARESISLNEHARKLDSDATDARLLAIENRRRAALELEPLASLDELNADETADEAGVETAEGASASGDDSSTEDALQLPDHAPDLAEADPFAREAAQVLVDFIQLRNKVRGVQRPVMR
ncbi:MAG: hypothetical protein DRQ55_13375 [Planctomycetota bacterium]|nr:MAG: hypothetical protein DRQ55_13375 [Planctomycetota bacterium]